MGGGKIDSNALEAAAASAPVAVTTAGRHPPLTAADLVEHVLLAVEQIPPGRVASYGLIAAVVGTGPRQVGTVMRDHGAAVAWWRVTRRDGDLGGGLLEAARPHWQREGIEIKPNGLGCRYAEHAVAPAELAAAYRRALQELEQEAAAPEGGGDGIVIPWWLE